MSSGASEAKASDERSETSEINICFIGPLYHIHSYSIVLWNHVIDLYDRNINVCVMNRENILKIVPSDTEFTLWPSEMIEKMKSIPIVDQVPEGYFSVSFTPPNDKDEIDTEYTDIAFYTCEFSTNITQPRNCKKYITCSEYSLNNQQNDTIKLNTFIVPHGVDKKLYRKCSEIKKKKWILFAGYAATMNKGIIEAIMFIHLLRQIDPEYILIIKPSNFLYESSDSLTGTMQYLHENKYISAEQMMDLINNGIMIINNSLNMEEMVELYNMCAYTISPYRAECFNLPVYESLACGTPVLIPDKGCTNEHLVKDSSVVMINSINDPQNPAVHCIDVMDAVNKLISHSFQTTYEIVNTLPTWTAANNKLLELLNE